MSKEFREKNLKQWESKLKEIFPNIIPRTVIWEKKEDIISILNSIGDIESLNHTFFPTKGGFDLTGCKDSREHDCIELMFGRIPFILKPDKLFFESFNADLEWAYFRLETKNIDSSGIYEGDFVKEFGKEELVELEDGTYLDRMHWDEGFIYDEYGEQIDMPSSARLIARNLRGSFVIFAKGSKYNENESTYDARHDKMSGSEFRQHIQDVIEYLKNKK